MTATQMQSDLRQRAKELYQSGQLSEAAQLFSDAIAQSPTSELWNDWAAVQTSLGQLADAERGFRLALRLDRGFTLATENLGALLFALGRFAEATPLLQQSLGFAPEANRPTIEKMLVRCRRPPSPGKTVPATVEVPRLRPPANLQTPPKQRHYWPHLLLKSCRMRSGSLPHSTSMYLRRTHESP